MHHEDEIGFRENVAAMAATTKKQLLLTYTYLIVYVLLSSSQSSSTMKALKPKPHTPKIILPMTH